MSEVFQISNTRYVAIDPIKDSPCFLAREVYQCEDAPTGWYTTGEPQYIEAPTDQEAAQGFVDQLKVQQEDAR